VHVVAAATTSYTFYSLQIYVDSTYVYHVASKNLDTWLSMGAGSHKITVKGWDSAGSFSSTVLFTVQ
jgi:hypothetical protein